jgi:hypothetical protein
VDLSSTSHSRCPNFESLPALYILTEAIRVLSQSLQANAQSRPALKQANAAGPTSFSHHHAQSLVISRELLTAMLSNWMQHCPPWQTNGSAAGQQICRLWWNPKVHYRVRNRQSPVPTLCQTNPIHVPQSNLLGCSFQHYSRIYAYVFQVFFPFRFLHQSPLWILFLPMHATCPAHPILLNST